MKKCKYCGNKLQRVEMMTITGWNKDTNTYPECIDKSWWCDFCAKEAAE